MNCLFGIQFNVLFSFMFRLSVASTAYCVVVDCRLLSAIVLVSIDTRDKSKQNHKPHAIHQGTKARKGRKQKDKLQSKEEHLIKQSFSLS